MEPKGIMNCDYPLIGSSRLFAECTRKEWIRINFTIGWTPLRMHFVKSPKTNTCRYKTRLHLYDTYINEYGTFELFVWKPFKCISARCDLSLTCPCQQFKIVGLIMIFGNTKWNFSGNTHHQWNTLFIIELTRKFLSHVLNACMFMN